jgi:DNA-binding NtrC family response regulator
MTSEPTILIVDDDEAVGRVLGALLKQGGFSVEVATRPTSGLEVLGARPIDMVIADLRMPEMNGIELLRRVRADWPEIPVAMLTAHGSVDDAVEAMKLGAVDFLQKPFDRDEIMYVVKKSLNIASADAPGDEPPRIPARGDFVGSSEAMHEVFDLIERAARGTATVLVRGETGTGKELVARAIHDESPRCDASFVKVHCAALPESLLESELFGHEKGAFTGATRQKPGRLELAEGGTLFLDEIGDISPATQVKLLRVLQDREFERVGGTSTLTADVRFVAATHRDLDTMVREGEFREDLFYRLNVLPIWTPPLRERPGDVGELARFFCSEFAEQASRDVALSDEALEALEGWKWPGNVRELQNFVERLVVMPDDETIRASDVAREFERGPASSQKAVAGTLQEEVKRTEERAIREALKRCGNNRTQAARVLGVSRRTLYNKLDELGIGA